MPKTYRHETIIALPRETLFAVMTDINNWPKWDLDLVAATHDGTALRPGSGFSITPKGNKPVAMTVEAIEARGCSLIRQNCRWGAFAACIGWKRCQAARD